MSKQKSSVRFRFTGAALLLDALLFLVPALRTGDPALYLLAALVPGVLFLCTTLLARMFSLDRMLVTVSLHICAAGIAALALQDAQAALAQALRCSAGIAALLAGGVMIRSLSPSLLTSACTAFLGLLFLAGRLFSPALSVPLEEAALALLLISFAAFLTRQGALPALLVGTAALAMLLAGGDTAGAVLWAAVVLLLLFSADGRLLIVLPSLAVVILLFFGAFRLFPALSVRSAGPSLEALAAAGAVGADVLPEGLAMEGSFSLFPLLAGHYGLILAALTVLLFLPLTLRGTFVASTARTRFHAVMAMGISAFLALRTIAALLSLFGFLPLGGVSVPLLTSSLADLCAQLFLIGVLCGIAGRNAADLAEDAHLAMLAK